MELVLTEIDFTSESPQLVQAVAEKAVGVLKTLQEKAAGQFNLDRLRELLAQEESKG